MELKALSYTHTIDADKEISDVRLKKDTELCSKKLDLRIDFSSAKAPLGSNGIFFVIVKIFAFCIRNKEIEGNLRVKSREE